MVPNADDSVAQRPSGSTDLDESQEERATDSIRVLHVDDEPRFTDLAAEYLERVDERFDVVTESGAPSGLDRLDGEPIDCVVSDYEMPKMDGLDFLERVRDSYEDLPFILFTGRGSEAVASDAIAAGVTDYLQKETGTDQYTVLANRIGNAVEQHRSQRALAESQKRLSLFIDQSPLGVVEFDESLSVVRINDAAERILGYPERKLRGESWRQFVPESEWSTFETTLESLLTAEGGYHDIAETVTADGNRIVCEWHNRVIHDDDGAVVAVFSQFQDVTDRYEGQRRLETLHESTRRLVRAQSKAGIADIATETAANVLEMPINSVYEYDEEEHVLTPMAVTDAVREILGDPPVFRSGESIAWEVYESGQSRVYEDVSEDGDRYADDTEIRSEMVVPLGDHGVMLIGATDEAAFDETDVARARILASNVEVALSRIDREESLRESRQRYRTLVDNFPDGGVFLYDDDLRYILAGGEEIEEIGLTPEEMIGDTPFDLFPEDIAEQQEPHFRAALDGESRSFEQFYQGEWYRSKTVPVGDEDVDTAMAVSQNVTERKERLRKLETLIDNLPGMVYRCKNEPGWPMEEVRGDVLALTGYPAERLERGDGFWGQEVLHPDDREEIWDVVQTAIENDDSFEVTYRIVTDGGTTKWMWERGRAVTKDEGTTYLEGFITDVTDRMETEERLSAFVELSSEAVCVVDEDGTFRSLSPSVEDVFGYVPAALDGDRFTDYVHPDDREGVDDAFGAVVDRGTTRRFDYRFRTAADDWQRVESVCADRTDTVLDGYVLTSGRGVDDQ